MGKKAIQYEAGQNVYDWAEMTDSGDATVFNAAFSPFSAKNGDPSVAPYGVLTGLEVSVDTGTNDSVSVSAGTVQAPGMTGADSDGVVAVSADSAVAITRAVSTDTHAITSITVDNTGTIVAVAGTDGTAFSETRGAAGGPPYIPVGSIELAQVRTTSDTAAEVLASEIKVVPNTHREMADFPVFALNYAEGKATFNQALPLIHTGDVAKKVYVKGEAPSFAQLAYCADWQPAQSSYSVSSTNTFDGPVGTEDSSLGQAGFTAQGKDGITDAIAKLKGQKLWFKYLPDDDATYPYQLTLGTLGISWTSPAGKGKLPINCTISASEETTDVLSA